MWRERERMRVDRRVNYNSVKYSVLLYLLRGRLSIDVYRPLQWRVRTLRSWTTGRFVACTRMVVTSFRGLLQFEWYSLLFLSWSFEVCRPSSSCPGGKFFVIPTGRHATRDTLNDGFWNRWNSLVSLSLFFFLSLEIYARANETSVAYDDTKDINTGKGNCFASNRCRSKCASSCNRDARGEMFSVKDYRCVRFLIIIGVTFNKPEFWLLRSLVWLSFDYSRR